MGFYMFLLSVLCVWRITHLFHAEDGPWDLLARLRRLAGNGVLGKMMDCFYCLSLWVALPIAVLAPATRLECVLWWPALSAGAILLERFSSLAQPELRAHYVEHPPLRDEQEAVLLVEDK